MADVISSWVGYYASNTYRNVTHMLDGMDAIRWIRLIAFIGAYFLLRPYLLKFGAKTQAAEHEKSLDLGKKEKKKKAKISANTLRGEVEVPDSEEDDGEDGVENGAEWGKKAKKRSRKLVKDILAEQERLLEEDDCEDIKEFLDSDVLVDYEVGKDGW